MPEAPHRESEPRGAIRGDIPPTRRGPPGPIRRDLHGLIPREHGSWAYLLIPQVAAILASPGHLASALWGLAAALLFSAFQAFAAAARRHERFSAAGAVAGAAGLILLTLAARGRTIAIACIAPSLAPVALGLLRTRGRIGRDDAIEVLGIVATSILGAGGFLAGGGRTSEAILLAVAVTAYSILSLIWIRVRLNRELPGRRTLLPAGLNIPASLAILVASAAAGFASGRLAAGLLPGIYCIRVLMPVPRRPDGLVRVSRLGIQEGVMAAIFAVGLGLFLPA